MSIDSRDTDGFEGSTRPCPCRACQNHRRYQRIHQEKHKEQVKAYYVRNQEKILLQKAYARYLQGRTKKFHKETLVRMKKAGFSIPLETASQSTFSDDILSEQIPSFIATEAY